MSGAALPMTRAELLRCGARVIEARIPTMQAAFRIEDPRKPMRCRVRFDWPGIVTVSDDRTGEVLARSIPGRPTDADAWTLALDMRDRVG